MRPVTAQAPSIVTNRISVLGSATRIAVIVAMSVGTGAMNVVVAGRIAEMVNVVAVMGGAMAVAGATTEAAAASLHKNGAPKGARRREKHNRLRFADAPDVRGNCVAPEGIANQKNRMAPADRVRFLVSTLPAVSVIFSWFSSPTRVTNLFRL